MAQKNEKLIKKNLSFLTKSKNLEFFYQEKYKSKEKKNFFDEKIIGNIFCKENPYQILFQPENKSILTHFQKNNKNFTGIKSSVIEKFKQTENILNEFFQTKIDSKIQTYETQLKRLDSLIKSKIRPRIFEQTKELKSKENENSKKKDRLKKLKKEIYEFDHTIKEKSQEFNKILSEKSKEYQKTLEKEREEFSEKEKKLNNLISELTEKNAYLVNLCEQNEEIIEN